MATARGTNIKATYKAVVRNKKTKKAKGGLKRQLRKNENIKNKKREADKCKKSNEHKRPPTKSASHT